MVFDFKRTLLFASFGCFMAAPVLNFHYGTLLPFIRPGTDMASTLVKVAVDQLLFAPFFLTYLFASLD